MAQLWLVTGSSRGLGRAIVEAWASSLVSPTLLPPSSIPPSAPSRRGRAALLELGVRPRLASNTAGSPWYLARAKALSVGLSNAYFKSLGLPTLIDDC